MEKHAELNSFLKFIILHLANAVILDNKNIEYSMKRNTKQ